jgi:hypothetical protein
MGDQKRVTKSNRAICGALPSYSGAMGYVVILPLSSRCV